MTDGKNLNLLMKKENKTKREECKLKKKHMQFLGYNLYLLHSW